MEARDKKILVQSVSVVLIIVVLFNVYSGITVSKIGIPGLIDIEFNSNDEPSGQGGEPSSVNPNNGNGQSDERIVSQEEFSSGETTQEPGSSDDQKSYEPEYPQDMYPEEPPIQPTVDLTGIWYGADGSEYDISQEGGTVYFTEYGLFGITAEGSGTLQNGRLIFNYQTVLGTSGRATLEVSPNGRIISGTADDFTSGVSTPLYLTRY